MSITSIEGLREETSLGIPVEARGLARCLHHQCMYIYIHIIYCIHDMFGKEKNDAKSDQSTLVCSVLRGVSSFKTQMHDHLWVLIYSFLPMAQNHCTMMQKKRPVPNRP